jgi:4-amino-4-deoxy-L-arabinose transferase-like glycosyltransferase
MSRSTLLVAGLAWALFCAAAGYVAGHASATFDEVPHIAAGVAYLSGDLRLNREHPPLVKVLAAANLPSRDPPLPLPDQSADPDGAQWTWGSEWLHGARQKPLYLLLRARLPLVLLSSVLVFLVALWTQQLAGALAACAAVCLLATCPTWIAHSALLTTDAPATLFFFGASYSGFRLARCARERRWRHAAWLAVFLALALATKYSMISAVGLVPLGVALDALWLRRREVLLWAAAASGLGGVVGILFSWGLPPQPALYLEGVEHVGRYHLKGFMYYAFGSFFHEQDPLYFARALLVKLSLPVVVLCGISPLVVRGSGLPSASGRGEPRFSWLLVLPPLGYYLLMATQAPAIGVRYVLPVLPFLCVLAGVAAAGLWSRPRLRWSLALLAAAQVVGFASALRATPLAFFNGLGCSTSDALPCLDDSNVDWGQALPDLKRFRDEHFPNQTLRIFYYGSSPPRAYVDHIELAQSGEIAKPLRAIYAMSLHHRVRSPKQAWPRQLEPSAVVGGAYAIFDLRQLPPKAAPARVPAE